METKTVLYGKNLEISERIKTNVTSKTDKFSKFLTNIKEVRVNIIGFTSLGGFATAEYYQMTRDKILVDGATGTSNQINYSSPMARRLVLDSLHYWSHDMGVDGFRFDLATVLGRSPRDAEPDDWGAQKRFFNEHPLLTGIASLAEKENLEVIAEAWDVYN